MKKIIISFKSHSFIDIITNSSTELFVTNKDKDVQTVKEILQKILTGYNIMVDGTYKFEDVFGSIFKFNLKEYRKERKAWFNTPESKESKWDNFHSEKFPGLHGWFYDLKDKRDIEYLRKHYIESGDNSGGWWSSERDHYRYEKEEIIEKILKKNPKLDRWKAKDEAVDTIYENIKKSKIKPDWWNKPNEYYYQSKLIEELDDCIIIIGESDNSIPFEIWDIINNQLGGFNIHCG